MSAVVAPTPGPSPDAQLAIAVREVGKCYEVYRRPHHRLLQTLHRGRRTFYEPFWALRGVSFELRRGESVGILGRNGSGKSTLLQMIAGVLHPTEGEIEVHGRVAALLELGSGFNPEFTGEENVFLNARILGLSRRETERRFDDIAAFADIGEFLRKPVKTYSSGMVVRLAFAVQVQVEPDILIIDEALAVGDALFQKRCHQRMRALIDSGVTLLFVSHNTEAVRTLTQRALLLRDGRVSAAGESKDVILEYRRQTHEDEKAHEARAARAVAARAERAPLAAPTPALSAAALAAGSREFGDLDAVIERAELLDALGQPSAAFRPDERVTIRVRYEIRARLTRLHVGFRLRNREGVKVYSGGTFADDLALWNREPEAPGFWHRHFEPGQRVVVEFAFDNILGTGMYEVQAYAAEERSRHPDDQRIIHWRDEAAFFSVVMDRHSRWYGGVCNLNVKTRVVE